MHLKISSVKWRPSCPGGDELINVTVYNAWTVNWWYIMWSLSYQIQNTRVRSIIICWKIWFRKGLLASLLIETCYTRLLNRRNIRVGYHMAIWLSTVRTYHYNDVTMSAVVSQITSLAIVYSAVYSGADQRKHQSSASLAFARGIHRWPMNSLHKGPVTRKMFSFDDVICGRIPVCWSDVPSTRIRSHM